MVESVKYEHWSKIPKHVWRWENFTPEEIASKGDDDNSILIHFKSLDMLQEARSAVKLPFIINSAYRTPEYNAAVDGSPNSMHLTGQAFDISLDNHDKFLLLAALRDAGFTGFGGYTNFIHADTGRERWWGQDWVTS